MRAGGRRCARACVCVCAGEGVSDNGCRPLRHQLVHCLQLCCQGNSLTIADRSASPAGANPIGVLERMQGVAKGPLPLRRTWFDCFSHDCKVQPRLCIARKVVPRVNGGYVPDVVPLCSVSHPFVATRVQRPLGVRRGRVRVRGAEEGLSIGPRVGIRKSCKRHV